MARLEDFDPTSRKHFTNMEMPAFASTSRTAAKPAANARVAIISTAGLQRRRDQPFTVGSGDYRLIPGDVAAGDLVMSHISTNFDRTGFQEDHNVVLPINRLNELQRGGRHRLGRLDALRLHWRDAAGPHRARGSPARAFQPGLGVDGGRIAAESQGDWVRRNNFGRVASGFS